MSPARWPEAQFAILVLCGTNAGRQAVAMALQPKLARPITECGVPHVYSYEELLRAVAHEADIQPVLIPTPFAAWDALAWIAEFLPGPADYSEPGGTDAGRQRIVSSNAGIC